MLKTYYCKYFRSYNYSDSFICCHSSVLSFSNLHSLQLVLWIWCFRESQENIRIHLTVHIVFHQIPLVVSDVQRFEAGASYVFGYIYFNNGSEREWGVVREVVAERFQRVGEHDAPRDVVERRTAESRQIVPHQRGIEAVPVVGAHPNRFIRTGEARQPIGQFANCATCLLTK